MNKPALDVDMLVELQKYLIDVQEKLITPESNALINTRIIMKKNHRMAEVAELQKRIDFLKGLSNKNHNFLSFLRHYLDLKKEDRISKVKTI